MHQVAAQLSHLTNDIDFESCQIQPNQLSLASWQQFHQQLANPDSNSWPSTLHPTGTSVPGFFQCNVDAMHPQNSKLWLYEQGLIKNLWTHDLQDLAGFPEILINAIKGLNLKGETIRLKMLTIPPEWINDGQYSEFIPTTTIIRIIQTDDPVFATITSLPVQMDPTVIRASCIINYQYKLTQIKGHVIAEGQRTLIIAPYLTATSDSQMAHQIQNKRINASLAVTKILDQNDNKGWIENKIWTYRDSDVDTTPYNSPSNGGSPYNDSYSFDTIAEANIDNMMEG